MTIKDKLKLLPHKPGVYFHKDKDGQIIYVGKAAILKNRVKQYFQNTLVLDAKTKALVSEIVDFDWVETESEIDALFLESEMVKRYMPKYNILLRDDKSLIYIRIDMKSDWPYVSYTRNPSDDGAEYFGPYYNGFAIKKALRHLRKIFPYYNIKPTVLRSDPGVDVGEVIITNKTKKDSLSQNVNKPDLDTHLGLSPFNMSSGEYKANLRKLIEYLNGNRKSIINDIKSEMKEAADNQRFEEAAKFRNKLKNLNEIQRRIMFGDKEFLDISKDLALRDITDLLSLKKIPIRIEGFDISHMSGSNVVASQVVFKNGVSDRSDYRKYKITVEKNDDFSNMNEVISRRLSQKNLKNWGIPGLVLIDGGKGQLDAALQARNKLGQINIPFIGLTEENEQIVVKNTRIDRHKVIELGGSIKSTNEYSVIELPTSTHIIKLLQRIRDESHRFAISYHSSLKRTKQTISLLDEIPGIGPKTRSKLLREFGSIKGIKSADKSKIIELIGSKKANRIISNLMV